MPFTIIRQDITRMHVDAIVNASNTALLMGGGVCGAIFAAAGADAMQTACSKLAPIKVGEAVITPAFNLPCKYVIHAAGPVYQPLHADRCRELLSNAYASALQLARINGCESLAFPLISGGIYGYPKEAALRTATDTIEAFLADYDMDVYLAIFDEAAFMVSEELMGSVESYIGAHYAAAHTSRVRAVLPVERQQAFSEAELLYGNTPQATAAADLDTWMQNLDEPFSATLLRLIDQRGQTDVAVYKRANIDRKLFSKIRSGKGYLPSKRTVIALAIALNLSLPETDALLECAGYALSRSQKFDVIIEYFIVNRRYNVFEINEVLFKYDQPLLDG